MPRPDSPYALGAAANAALLDLFAEKFFASQPAYFRHVAKLDLVDMVVEVEARTAPVFELGPLPAAAGAVAESAAELGLALAADEAPEPDVHVRLDALELRTFALANGRKGAPLDTFEASVSVYGALVVDGREASIASLGARVEADVADATLSHVLTAMLRKTFADKVQGLPLPRVSHVIGAALDFEVEDAEIAGARLWMFGSLEPTGPEGAPKSAVLASGPLDEPARIEGYVRADALRRALEAAFVPPRPTFERSGSKSIFAYRLEAEATVGRPALSIAGGRAEAAVSVAGRASLHVKGGPFKARIPLAAATSRARLETGLRADASGRRLVLALGLAPNSLRLRWRPGGSVLRWVAPVLDLAITLLASVFAPLVGDAIAAAVGKVELTVFEVPEARIPGTDLEADVSIERVGFEGDCATAMVAVK